MLLHYVAANGVEDHRQRVPENAVEIADELISRGADIHASCDMYEQWGPDGSTPLVELVTGSHPGREQVVGLVHAFARSGQSIDGPNRDSVPLGFALSFRMLDAAHALVECGARVGVDPNVKLLADFTPLHEACFGGHLEAIEVLIEAGAKIDARDTQWNATPARWAEVGGHPEVVEVLAHR